MFEAVYLGIPNIGMFFAIVRCYSSDPATDAAGFFLIFLATTFVAIQFFLSVSTLVHVLGARKRLAEEHNLR